MSLALAIVGFMGAGKSTVGEAIAARLGLPFADSDEVIVATHGPMESIFADEGEGRFREWEREVALKVLARAVDVGGVVSLGGGAVTSDDVREALTRLAHVVWLDAPLEVLFARSHGPGRPLARDEAAFRRLYATRRPLYEQVATTTLRSGRDTRPDELVAEVLASVAT